MTSIIIRLGDDFNWWLDRTADESPLPPADHGLLDPRQVRHLVEALAEYRRHGLDPRQITGAFHLFALPAIDADGDGPYFDFLDALSAARIRRLNATGHYLRDCTVDEMQDELDTLDHDRYFNADQIHVFDQINEILAWSPAEWEEP